MSGDRSPHGAPRRRRPRGGRAIALLLAAALAGACGEEPPELSTGPVANPELGLAMDELPERCTISRNEGRDLVLACGSRRGTTGEVLFQVGAERVADLAELASGQRQAFEAMPHGRFLGHRQLATPSGPAFTASGRYVEDGKSLEEIRVLALHPGTRTLLVVRSRYPEGDEADGRMEQLLAIFAAVRPTGSAASRSPAGP